MEWSGGPAVRGGAGCGVAPTWSGRAWPSGIFYYGGRLGSISACRSGWSVCGSRRQAGSSSSRIRPTTVDGLVHGGRVHGKAPASGSGSVGRASLAKVRGIPGGEGSSAPPQTRRGNGPRDTRRSLNLPNAAAPRPLGPSGACAPRLRVFAYRTRFGQRRRARRPHAQEGSRYSPRSRSFQLPTRSAQ